MKLINFINDCSDKKPFLHANDGSYDYFELKQKVLEIRETLEKANIADFDLLLIIGDYDIKSIASVIAAIDLGINITIQTPHSYKY